MRSTQSKIIASALGAIMAMGGLSACKSTPKILGGSGVAKSGTFEAAPRMGVNSFLWRASLETLEFMPLDQVDPFGGVIITDWYSNPKAPNERFKANVYILDANLRADALKASIFKQTRSGGGGWVDASIDEDTSRQIENAILTRARELYISAVDNG